MQSFGIFKKLWKNIYFLPDVMKLSSLLLFSYFDSCFVGLCFKLITVISGLFFVFIITVSCILFYYKCTLFCKTLSGL